MYGAEIRSWIRWHQLCDPLTSLQWRHNGCDGVSNHQPHDCVLNRLFRRRSKKNRSSASLAFVRRIHRWLENFQHKWPVTRKMFPFDDVIMGIGCLMREHHASCHLDVNESYVLIYERFSASNNSKTAASSTIVKQSEETAHHQPLI